MTLTAYRIDEHGVPRAEAFARTLYSDDIVWIDAFDPSDNELQQLSGIMGFDVPDRHDMTEIELSSRLYKTGDAFVMVANLLPKFDKEILPPHPAAFILRENLLLTLRYVEFYSFERVANEIVRSDAAKTPRSIFGIHMDEAISDRADDLEFSMRHLETLTSRLFRRSLPGGVEDPEDPELADALNMIGGMGERVAGIRESLASLQRVLNFARTYFPEKWLADQKAVLNSMIRDLTALSDEAAFFMNKLSFNLDATLGMINIEETKIMRILSIVTLVLSPPMLIAGIYGMNFANMPELEWPHGYLLAWVAMALTALAPIWYLKKKKWL